MKKSLWLSLISIIVFQTLVSSVLSAESSDSVPKTTVEVIKTINEDMKTLYGESNYYPTQTSSGALRTDLLQKNIDNNTNNFEMVYGQSHGPVLTHKNNKMYATRIGAGKDREREQG